MSEADLDQRLQAALERGSGKAPRRTAARADGFLRAAAVLWRFDPERLVPDLDGGGRDHEASEWLHDRVIRLRGEDAAGGGWTLRDAYRPDLLRELDAAELARLRALYPGPTGPEQTLVDAWLTGADPRLDGYGLDELAVVARVRTWFEPVPSHFPDPDTLERLRAAARFRAPLQHLVGSWFQGRTVELAVIGAFVHDPPPAEPALLVIHGVGGVGKSTLTAKFLLDTLARHDASHLLAYLDFDLPTLDISDGVSIMLELAAQGAAQRPDAPGLKDIADRAAHATLDLAAGRGRAPGRALAVRASMYELADAFGAALRAASVTRVTMVFDTFEEIQYANAEHQRFLEEQLAALHERLPSLRTVLVSRARIELPGAVHLELGDLDEPSARAYLTRKNIVDPAQVQAALEVSQRNPLSLKLAVEVLRRTGRDVLGDLAASRDALEQELVQGQLYRRILQHVHQPQVQQLAHPGLVVRRVTPAIIQEVLAVPCGLGAIDDAQARTLFDELAREVSLVKIAQDGAVEHRADVRRVMLKLLYRDRPALAREIHECAAEYYQRSDDDVSIAEEAYHRFALGGTAGPWADRLTPGAKARLRGALEELPEPVVPAFASHVGIDLPPELMRAGTVADVERRLAERLRELLATDHLEEAVALLAQNPPSSPGSVLWRWQGRVFALIGRMPEALDALERSLATLAGPKDEAHEDARLAAEVAAKLDRADSQQRLETMAQPPAAAPVAYAQSLPLEQLVVQAQGEVRWLDDQELRVLVGQTIDAEQRKGGFESAPPAAPRSTRAASVYAQAIKLNQTPERDDGSVPLLEWAEKAYGKSHESLSALKATLKSLLKP